MARSEGPGPVRNEGSMAGKASRVRIASTMGIDVIDELMVRELLLGNELFERMLW